MCILSPGQPSETRSIVVLLASVMDRFPCSVRLTDKIVCMFNP